MSLFFIKIIACITMILDHIKYVIPVTNNFFTQYLGRISFPLFAFTITEGYSHTRDLTKYYERLFIFAIISQIPFMLFRTFVGEYMLLNIIFTLLLGLICITIYENIDIEYLSIPLICLIIYLGYLVKVDYGWYGVCTVFLFHILKDEKKYLWISFFILSLIYFYSRELLSSLKIDTLYNFLFIMSSLVFITIYNGKKGKSLKFFFYLFYPIHMLIFYFVGKIFV